MSVKIQIILLKNAFQIRLLVRQLCQKFSAPLPPELDTIKVNLTPNKVIFILKRGHFVQQGVGFLFSFFRDIDLIPLPIANILMEGFIFKEESGTFFKSEVARGLMRPEKRPQEFFLQTHVGICNFRFLFLVAEFILCKWFRSLIAAKSRLKAAKSVSKCLFRNIAMRFVFTFFIDSLGHLTNFWRASAN